MFLIKKFVRQGVHNIQLGSKVPLYWWNKKNWGDALNPVIAEFAAERHIKFTNIKYCYGFLAIGSVLSLANSRTVVWGSGFMSSDQTCKESPRKVCAVRGPLTKQVGSGWPTDFGCDSVFRWFRGGSAWLEDPL